MVKTRQEKPILVQENDELVEPATSHQVQHERHNRVKHGDQRLDKRSAQGVSGLPKKSGQGGKFTWGGPLDSVQDGAVVAIDEKDPNYVDEEEVIQEVAPVVPDVSRTDIGSVQKLNV